MEVKVCGGMIHYMLCTMLRTKRPVGILDEWACLSSILFSIEPRHALNRAPDKGLS